jgi:hypothetical protein
MAQLQPREIPTPEPRDLPTPGVVLRSAEKSVKILAKSLYRELRSNGYDDRQIVALSTELISLLTTEMKEDER